jgi:hypothetical protein
MPATFRRNPTADGALYTGFTASGGAKWQCIDEGYGASVDTDYIYVAASSAATYSWKSSTTIPAYVGKVESVIVEAQLRNMTDTNAWGSLGVSFAASDTTAGSGSVSTTYIQVTTAALARPGGGSWVKGDLDAASYEVRITTSNNAGIKRCSQMNDRIDFEYEAGGFVSMISSLIGPVAALSLVEFPKLAQLVRARTGIAIWRSSVEDYFRQWREARFPVYCFQGV